MRLFRRRRVHTVTLYGKPGCHLCDDARTLLAHLNGRFPMVLEEVDITTDPQLFRRYDIFIPVIVIDEEGELRAPVSERDLIRAFKGR